MTESSNTIDQTRAERALDYLVSTDEEYGQVSGLIKILETKRKRSTKMELVKLMGTDGTVVEREAKAATSQTVKSIEEQLEDLYVQNEILAARRDTADLCIRLYQSISANSRKGGI